MIGGVNHHLSQPRGARRGAALPIVATVLFLSCAGNIYMQASREKETMNVENDQPRHRSLNKGSKKGKRRVGMPKMGFARKDEELTPSEMTPDQSRRPLPVLLDSMIPPGLPSVVGVPLLAVVLLGSICRAVFQLFVARKEDQSVKNSKKFDIESGCSVDSPIGLERREVERLEKLEMKLASRECQLKLREESIVDREAEATLLREALLSREADLGRRDAEQRLSANEREAELGRLAEELKGQQALIAKRASAVKVREEELSAREARLTHEETSIAKSLYDVYHQEARVKSREAALERSASEKEADMSQREAAIAAREEMLLQLESSLRLERAQVDQRELNVEKRESSILMQEKARQLSHNAAIVELQRRETEIIEIEQSLKHRKEEFEAELHRQRSAAKRCNDEVQDNERRRVEESLRQQEEEFRNSTQAAESRIAAQEADMRLREQLLTRREEAMALKEQQHKERIMCDSKRTMLGAGIALLNRDGDDAGDNATASANNGIIRQAGAEEHDADPEFTKCDRAEPSPNSELQEPTQDLAEEAQEEPECTGSDQPVYPARPAEPSEVVKEYHDFATVLKGSWLSSRSTFQGLQDGSVALATDHTYGDQLRFVFPIDGVSKVVVELGNVTVTQGHFAVGFRLKNVGWLSHKTYVVGKHHCESVTLADAQNDYSSHLVEFVIQKWTNSISKASLSKFRLLCYEGKTVGGRAAS